jgi:hypothetical protein
MRSEPAMHDPDAIIGRVLGRFRDDDQPERNRTYRAVIVLDLNLAALGPALREADFHVVLPPPHALGTREGRDTYLAGRILVTRNSTPDLLDDAPVLGFGIIGLDALPSVSDSPKYTDNVVAQMISRGVFVYRLPTYRSGWVLMLHPGGKHRFLPLE